LNNFLKAGALALTIGLSFAGAADAAGVKSLFLGGDGIEQVDAVRLDIIGADGRFDQLGSASATLYGGVPTLSYLEQFDSVLVWTNFVGDSTGLSNVLGDYADAGGRVVIGTFWGQQVDALGQGGGGGKLQGAGYNPLINGVTDAYSNHTLGAFDAASPLMAGVGSLSSVYYNADYAAGLDAGATLVASWNDGRPLVAVNGAQNVIAVTLFPNVAQFHHADGDYRALFGNALAFTGAGVSAAPEPASWAMMVIGFGGMGAMVRSNRRRRVAVTAA
jgi:hypothetical protein